MGKKIWLIAGAAAAVGLGTAGILANTKQAKTRRVMKKAGAVMYTVGTMLRTLSCQVAE